MNTNSTIQRLKSIRFGKNFESEVIFYLQRNRIYFLRLTTYLKRFISGRMVNIFIPGMTGQPDFFIFLPGGKLIMIELKAGKGKMRPEQKAIQGIYEKLGFEYHVCHEIKDVKNILEV
jgi:hypothetical protein